MVLWMNGASAGDEGVSHVWRSSEYTLGTRTASPLYVNVHAVLDARVEQMIACKWCTHEDVACQSLEEGALKLKQR